MSEDVGYKQVLTRKDLFGIAVGMIIGAGVMTLTGIGIDRTGRSVFISWEYPKVCVNLQTDVR